MNFVVLDHNNYEDFSSVIKESFLSNKDRIALGAYEDDGTVLGAVSYVLAGYEYVLDWLFVDPDCRREKVATEILDKIFESMEMTLEIYPLSARFDKSEENTGLYEFFKSYPGFDIEYSHSKYFIKAEDIMDAAPLYNNASGKVKAVNFFDEPVSRQKYIMETVENSGLYQIEDFEAWSNTCEKNLCRVTIDGNNILDFIIIQKKTDGNLRLAYLFSKYPEGLADLLAEVAKDIVVDYPDTELEFEAVSEKSVLLAKKLFPEATEISVYEAIW